MYFMVNTPFVNYLDQTDNLTETLEFPILKNKTTFKQTLPLSLNISKFDSELLTAPRNLKDFIHQYNCKKEIFDLNERHDTTDLTTNKNFFSNNCIVDVFLFTTAVISLLLTNIAYYLLSKHKRPRTLVSSLALQQVKEEGTVTTQEEVTTECKIQIYIILALTVTIFYLVMFAVLHSRKLKLCWGHMFSNTVKIMLFIFPCTILCTYKTVYNGRKHSLIQNYRYAKTRKCKIKLNLYLGYYRNRLEGGQHGFQ